MGKPQGKRPVGRPRLIWENNIRMDVKEFVCEGMTRIYLSQDREKWVVINLWVP